MRPAFTPALLALAADPASLTHMAIWEALSEEDRVSPLAAALASEEGMLMRRRVAGVLAAQRGGFRASGRGGGGAVRRSDPGGAGGALSMSIHMSIHI